MQLCQVIQNYYSDLAVVFSGCQGFHVHVMDFDYHDWAPYREKDPLWCHAASRFKFTKLLQKQTKVFDRAHFTVSVDPMRVVSVLGSLNAKTGMICRFIGSPYVLERLTISDLLDLCRAFPYGYPETLESSSLSSNGSMKPCAKNNVWAA